MHTRDEAERAIRHMATEWANEVNFRRQVGHYPSFIDFRGWMERKGFGAYFRFRSQVGPETEAQQWFESEIQQSWRWKEA